MHVEVSFRFFDRYWTLVVIDIGVRLLCCTRVSPPKEAEI